MEFIDIIPNIVKGLEIKDSATVILNFWGENKDLNILDEFTIEIAKVGAIPIKIQQSREFIKRCLEEVSLEHLIFDDKKFEVIKNAEVVIDIFTYGIAPHNELPKDKIGLYKEYMRKLFSVMSHEKDIFVQVRIPTEENAIDEGIDYELYKKSMYQALTVDCKELKEECARIGTRLEGKEEIAIYTGDNNVLKLNINKRKWNKDDGRGDIPYGEVYIAPVEDSVNGRILIPQVGLEGITLRDVLLEFENGKIISCSENSLVEFIKHFPGDSDVIAEFGIGLNDKIKEFVGCSLIDEKRKGTAHIAIGMNNMFGGNNESPLHMDFIFIPEKIEIDDAIIMRKDNLLI